MKKNIDSCQNTVVQRLIENGFIQSKDDLSEEDMKKLNEVIMNSDCYNESPKRK